MRVTQNGKRGNSWNERRDIAINKETQIGTVVAMIGIMVIKMNEGLKNMETTDIKETIKRLVKGTITGGTIMIETEVEVAGTEMITNIERTDTVQVQGEGMTADGLIQEIGILD